MPSRGSPWNFSTQEFLALGMCCVYNYTPQTSDRLKTSRLMMTAGEGSEKAAKKGGETAGRKGAGGVTGWRASRRRDCGEEGAAENCLMRANQEKREGKFSR